MFIPCAARKWAFYDIETGEWSYLPIPKEAEPSNEWRAAFGGLVPCGDDLIILPGERGVFAKYNIDTGKFTYHREWFAGFKSLVVNIDWGLFTGALYYNDSLLLVSPQTSAVIEFDPRKMTVFKTHKVGSGLRGFKSACLIPNTDTVYLNKFREPAKDEDETETETETEDDEWTETLVKWDIKSGKIKEITDIPVNLKEKSKLNALNGFVFWRGELFVTPLQGDCVLKVDLETDEITRFPLSPEFDFFERKTKYYEGWAKDQALPHVIFNGKRMTFTVQLPFDYSLADIDFESGDVTNRRKWQVSGVENLYETKDANPRLPLVESAFMPLEYFLDRLGTEELERLSEESVSRCCSPPANADGTAGKAILDYIKKSAGM
jgi:hypothetical protein